MAYESTEDLTAVRRGARASDPKGYGTAFEIQERKNDGYTPEGEREKKPFWWGGLIGLALIGTAVAIAAKVMRKHPEED